MLHRRAAEVQTISGHPQAVQMHKNAVTIATYVMAGQIETLHT